MGRKRAITDEQIEEISKRVATDEMKTIIAKSMRVSRESIYKLLKKSVA
ncbi:MAG: helix-turn-helix domain-containing protein [Desulfuromonadaceae bacterium]